MNNQEIITSLKNAVEHGDSLQTAMQSLVNSGYNPKEVQEASQLIGGITSQLESNEQLTTPNQKPSFFSKLNPFKKKQTTQTMPQKTQPAQQNPIIQTLPQTLPPIQQTQPTQNYKQLTKQSKPPKQNYTKEIILLSILIFLVGILITTIIFREEILNLFS